MKIIKHLFLFLIFIFPLGSYAASECPTIFSWACMGPPCPYGKCTFYSGSIQKTKPNSDVFQNEFDSGFDSLKSEISQSFMDINNQFLKSTLKLSDAYKNHLVDFQEETSKKILESYDSSNVSDKEYVDKNSEDAYQQDIKDLADNSPFNVVIDNNNDLPVSNPTLKTKNADDAVPNKVTVVDNKNLQSQCNLVKTKNAFLASNNKQLSGNASSFFIRSAKTPVDVKLYKESIIFGNRESELYGMNISSTSITTNHKGEKTLISVLPFIENVANNITKTDDLNRIDPLVVNNVLSYLSKLSVSRDTLLKIADENNSAKNMLSKIELLRKQTDSDPIQLNKKSSGYQNLYFSYLTDFTLSLEELSKYESLELILSSVLSENIKKRN
jgi:hypothetical protein